jgi:hypothetical protein
MGKPYRRVDASTLEYHATVEDPRVLTGIWTSPKRLIKASPPGTQLVEAMPRYDKRNADGRRSEEHTATTSSKAAPKK